MLRRRSKRAVAGCCRAFTLVEMLVAMALTLILVYAIAEFYAYVGDSVRDGRAMIEMSGEMRAVSTRLKSDLNSLTVKVQPSTDPGAGQGYFEYYEGPATDRDADANGTLDYVQATANNWDANGATSLVGDGDDYLAFTIRASGESFTGRFNGTIIRSDLAEVVWFTGFVDKDGSSSWSVDEPRFLYRRLLLIRPDLNGTTGYLSSVGSFEDARLFFRNNDLSVRYAGNNGGNINFAANSLSDLARRENRFAHWTTGNPGYPAQLLLNPTTNININPNITGNISWVLQGNTLGEDIILANVLGFDVRAYDTYAPIMQDSAGVTAVSPGDPGWNGGLTQLGTGAYVDLGYDGDTMVNPDGNWSAFNGAGSDDRSLFSAYPGTGTLSALGKTYDTWSADYERNPGNGNAFNGLDDDNANGVDDAGERMYPPPYPHQMRGLQVRIRMYEPSSRQSRQATVIADFLPE